MTDSDIDYIDLADFDLKKINIPNLRVIDKDGVGSVGIKYDGGDFNIQIGTIETPERVPFGISSKDIKKDDPVKRKMNIALDSKELFAFATKLNEWLIDRVTENGKVWMGSEETNKSIVSQYRIHPFVKYGKKDLDKQWPSISISTTIKEGGTEFFKITKMPLTPEDDVEVAPLPLEYVAANLFSSKTKKSEFHTVAILQIRGLCFVGGKAAFSCSAKRAIVMQKPKQAGRFTVGKGRHTKVVQFVPDSDEDSDLPETKRHATEDEPRDKRPREESDPSIEPESKRIKSALDDVHEEEYGSESS